MIEEGRGTANKCGNGSPTMQPGLGTDLRYLYNDALTEIRAHKQNITWECNGKKTRRL